MMENHKTQHRKHTPVRMRLKMAPYVAMSAARRLVDRMTAKYQKTFVSPDEIHVESYKDQGFSWFQKGEYVRARDAFFLYLKHEQERDPGILYMLAMCYKNMDEYKEAAEFLRQAEKARQHDPDIISALGECLFNIEEYPEAIVFLEKARRISPGDAGIYYRLGICHEKGKRPKEAEVFYKKAIALDPTRVEYHQTLGFLFQAEDRHREAIECLRNALHATWRQKRGAR